MALSFTGMSIAGSKSFQTRRSASFEVSMDATRSAKLRLVRLGQGRQRIEHCQQLIGLGRGEIEHQHGHVLIGRRLGPQVAVDQFQRPVRQLASQERIRVADFLQHGPQRRALRRRVPPPIARVWVKMVRGNSSQLPDSVAKGHRNVRGKSSGTVNAATITRPVTTAQDMFSPQSCVRNRGTVVRTQLERSAARTLARRASAQARERREKPSISPLPRLRACASG